MAAGCVFVATDLGRAMRDREERAKVPRYLLAWRAVTAAVPSHSVPAVEATSQRETTLRSASPAVRLGPRA
jgi:hypothetical protein